MKTLYIDCRTGASGDMIAGALLGLVPDRDASLARLNAMGIPGVVAEAKGISRCGISGTGVSVFVNGEEEGHPHEHCHEHPHEHGHAHDHGHAHGVMPVPAPATANILEGMPFSSGAADCELLTPTGAALLRHFAASFGAMPAMVVEKTGTGCGARDIPGRPNILRAFLGEEIRAEGSPNGMVTELKANIDDMTGEELAYACAKLRNAGALDVTLVQAIMKKGRPGQILEVLCRPEQADAMAAAILRETSTFGVRRADLPRYELDRTIETCADGVRVKKGVGYGVEKSKREFDDSHPAV